MKPNEKKKRKTKIERYRIKKLLNIYNFYAVFALRNIVQNGWVSEHSLCLLHLV